MLSCTLTTPELRERKATILRSLRTEIIETRALESGFSYTFSGTDEMVAVLADFITTERASCDFFTFTLVVDAGSARLDLTGPEGAKACILRESWNSPGH